MKITVFTSDSNRHINLINILANLCSKLYVIQEQRRSQKNYDGVDIVHKYFNNVYLAQEKIFPESEILNNKKIKLLSIKSGELSNLKLKNIAEYLESNLFIVFGASYIKGDLIKFLEKNRAINIHAGISPHYRGTDCNFWALYDNRPHLVGSTIHLLSEGLDNGPILYHAMPEININPFEYTMSSIKSAFISLSQKIEDGSIFKIEPVVQDFTKEIRFSKKKDFNSNIVEKYFRKNINLENIKFDKTLLIKPFFAKN